LLNIVSELFATTDQARILP